jgi:hypothetical protein
MAAAAAVLSYDASPISLHIASFIAAGEGREKGRKGGRERREGGIQWDTVLHCVY